MVKVLEPSPTTDVGDILVEGDLSAFREFWLTSCSVTPERRYVFQTLEVLEVWCRTIGRARNIRPLFVAVLDRASAPLLLLPLCIERHGGVKILKFIDGKVSDFNAPILFPGAHDLNQDSALALWRRIHSQLPQHDLVQFEKMPELVEDWPNPLRFLSTELNREGHYSMTLPQVWNEAAKKTIPKLSDSRRRLRKLSQLGDVSFVVGQNQEEAQQILSEMMRMKSAQYLRTQGRDRFLTEPGAAEFYIEATKDLLDTGTVHLSALKLNSQILAAHWGYIFGERFYHLMPAFTDEQRWRPYAPGRLLNEFLMEWAATRGLRVFDFGIGDEAYKVPYSDTHEVLHDAALPVTALGHAYHVLRRVRARAGSVVRGTAIEAPLRHVVRLFIPMLPFA